MANAFVDKLSGYAALTADDRAALARACEGARRVAARYDLIREGDKPGPVFILLEGWACRYKLLPEGGRQIMAFLMPGDFSDMHVAVLNEMDHSIAALTPARVVAVPRAQMQELTDSSPLISQALWWSQLVDEATLRAWIVSMGRRGSVERVAHLMCEIYVRARHIGLVQGPQIEFPLTQIVLADALGLTPVHVNRVLRTLRMAGVVEIGRGTLSITDPDKLVQIAGFDDNYLHRRLKLAA